MGGGHRVRCRQCFQLYQPTVMGSVLCPNCAKKGNKISSSALKPPPSKGSFGTKLSEAPSFDDERNLFQDNFLLTDDDKPSKSENLAPQEQQRQPPPPPPQKWLKFTRPFALAASDNSKIFGNSNVYALLWEHIASKELVFRDITALIKI